MEGKSAGFEVVPVLGAMPPDGPLPTLADIPGISMDCCPNSNPESEAIPLLGTELISA